MRALTTVEDAVPRHVDALARDLRYSARQLWRSPAFTISAILTIALGVGANAMLFAVLSALLLRPPTGVLEPERVVRLYVEHRARTGASSATPAFVSYPDFVDFREGGADVADVAAYYVNDFVPTGLQGGGRPLSVVLASDGYFSALGVRAARGRLFGVERSATPSTPIAVVSYRHWAHALGRDPDVVGRTLRLNGYDYTITGVAPEGFVGVDPGDPDLWLPLDMAPRIDMAAAWTSERAYPSLSLVVRLRQGVTTARAEALVRILAERLDRAHPEPSTVRVASVGPIRGSRFGATEGRGMATAATMLAITVVVLAIAITNVTNLSLARVARRRREAAVRIALGARVADLRRQLLAEGFLIALLGAVGALVAGAWTSSALGTLPLPPMVELVDARVLLFTSVLVVLVTLPLGLVPATRLGAVPVAATLQNGATGASPRRSPWARAVGGVQVGALAVLLVASGLLSRSVRNALAGPLGFDADRVLSARVELTPRGDAYLRELMLSGGAARARAFFESATDALGRLPGVDAVALGQSAPFSAATSMQITLPSAGGEAPTFWVLSDAVSAGYFRTLGVRTIRGRPLNERDVAGGPLSAVVTETAARRLWPGRDAVGECFRLGAGSAPCVTVVGIAADMNYDALRDTPPRVFLAIAQHPASLSTAMTLFLRTSGSPEALAPAVRSELAALAPDLPVVQVQSVREALRPWTGNLRLAAVLLSASGAMALLLAAVGLYGALAYTVSERTRELGVRVALGASRAHVFGLVVRDGLRDAAAGAVLGLAAAVVVARTVLATALVGVAPADGTVLLQAALVLLGTAAAASAVPALRATRVDPMVSMREES